MLKVKYPKTKEILEFNQFWLRDHCRCSECYSVKTKQRTYNIFDIPANIKMKTIAVTTEGQLLIEWSDGHKSIYDYEFLYNSRIERIKWKTSTTNLRTPWTGLQIAQECTNVNFELCDLISSDFCVKAVVTALVRHGIALVNGIPANTAMTEMAVRRLFPIMKTLFGEMYTFSDTLDHADTAYTKSYLGVHTDNTYFCDAAGLQVLHCLQHTNGEGGENFFVDGLKAALDFKHLHPQSYEHLCQILVPAEYIEKGQHHRYSAPIIRTDPITGDIVQLRLNVYDRAIFDSLPQAQMHTFYESFRKFLEIVQRPANQWCFKLQPHTMVIFDNWRILHGRNAYTGQRTMTGCYVQRTDFISTARVLGILD